MNCCRRSRRTCNRYLPRGAHAPYFAGACPGFFWGGESESYELASYELESDELESDELESDELASKRASK
jgi:hypothetical protein